jgi:hypothetical protein
LRGSIKSLNISLFQGHLMTLTEAYITCISITQIPVATHLTCSCVIPFKCSGVSSDWEIGARLVNLRPMSSYIQFILQGWENESLIFVQNYDCSTTHTDTYYIYKF